LYKGGAMNLSQKLYTSFASDCIILHLQILAVMLFLHNWQKGSLWHKTHQVFQISIVWL